MKGEIKEQKARFGKMYLRDTVDTVAVGILMTWTFLCRSLTTDNFNKRN